MGLLEEYLKNPCGVLSIPYWKNEKIVIPEDMKIVHQKEFLTDGYDGYFDEPYFRMFHPLAQVDELKVEGFCIRTAVLEDIPLMVDIINRSYSDLSVTCNQLLEYARSKVYDSNLWIMVYNEENFDAVGCGIAEIDRALREGVLEWIQVLPEYRGRKIGQLIVNELLRRLAGMADFATVSGKVNNLTKPELLYRKCGFTGADVWHVLTRRG